MSPTPELRIIAVPMFIGCESIDVAMLRLGFWHLIFVEMTCWKNKHIDCARVSVSYPLPTQMYRFIVNGRPRV